jgi:hypothetical protein
MGWVPRLRRYHEQLGLPALLPAPLGFLRWAAPRLRSVFVSPVRTNATRTGLGVVSGAAPLPSREEGAGSPRFLGNLRMRAPVFDPGGASAPGLLGASVLPSVLTTASASTGSFSRGSIPRPACSLSTLRSQGRPCTTQDSLPAGDQPYRTGLYPPQGPSRRFQQCFISSLPPPPSFPGAP